MARDIFDRYAALFGTDSVRVLRQNTRVNGRAAPAACAAVWPMDQWFGGRPVPAQAVAMVAVDPARRGGGVGSSLMRAVMAEGRAAGAAVSILCPATLPFYRRLGYGRGGVSCVWSAPPTLLSHDRGIGTEPDAFVSPTDPLNAVPLAALRRTMLTGGNGLPERNEALWTLALFPDGEPADVFLLNGPNGPEGYIALTPPRERRLAVADLCVPTGRSARLALRFLAGYRAQIDRVSWRGGPDDPLALLAEDIGVHMDGREEWLLRVLDARRALATRGYPIGLNESLTFDINDPLISDNHGRFQLQVANGVGVIAKSEKDDEPVATLGIAAFSSLFTGHACARAMRQAGLLHGKEVAVEILDRLFCSARPWMPDRF